MSCDDDYEYWAPVIDVVEENKLTAVEITAITREDLAAIEKAATEAIALKLDKLNVIFKNLNVYCTDNVILVNDRFVICRDLVEIAQAFGFEVKQVDCGLRGKTYILQDALFELIAAINPQFSVKTRANCRLTPELLAAIEKGARDYVVNSELSKIFREIKATGHYSIAGTQHITTTYEDGRMVDRAVGEVVSDKAAVTKRLRSYLDQTSSALKKTNENMRDGTVKLLYSRARQMGYSVKEERNGTQVQLVLVRCE